MKNTTRAMVGVRKTVAVATVMAAALLAPASAAQADGHKAFDAQFKVEVTSPNTFNHAGGNIQVRAFGYNCPGSGTSYSKKFRVEVQNKYGVGWVGSGTHEFTCTAGGSYSTWTNLRAGTYRIKLMKANDGFTMKVDGWIDYK